MANPTILRSITIVFLICLNTILASCNPQSLPSSVPETESTIMAFTPSPVQSQTPAFTATSLFTETPELRSTPSSLPTLVPQESENEIIQLLQNDVDCQPPCFLGVIPEKTTLDELINIINHLGLSMHDYEGKALAYAVEDFPTKQASPQTVYYVADGLVKSAEVILNQSSVFEWSAYSPVALLTRFGPPSEVTFGLQVIHEPSPTPAKGWYSMTFFYNDLDLIIRYSDVEITLGELITACPNKDDFSQGAHMWLGKSPEYAPLPTQDGPLREVTSFTPESFRDFLLLGPGACFELKATAIPIY